MTLPQRFFKCPEFPWFSPPSSPATFGRQVSREIKPDVEIKEEDEEELEEVAGRGKTPKNHEAPTKQTCHDFFLWEILII